MASCTTRGSPPPAPLPGTPSRPPSRPSSARQTRRTAAVSTMSSAARAALRREHSMSDDSAQHLNVLVVGAGISGIGVAYNLSRRLPGKSFAVLEAQKTFGGTWTVNRYPGVRSDSDMYTFGYSFKPWVKDELATADQIRAYLREVIEENNLGPYIRYQQRVTAPSWSSDTRQWTVDVTRADTGERLRYTADFVWMCPGYYRQDEGYTPRGPGMG